MCGLSLWLQPANFAILRLRLTAVYATSMADMDGEWLLRRSSTGSTIQRRQNFPETRSTSRKIDQILVFLCCPWSKTYEQQRKPTTEGQ